ncbi:MAG: DUF1361 domain-containing protein [Chloroflexi bacterium]|jgi:uncharacterized membrane protein|nr:DUF1361 domain-containing protein [Chloroflexota bacterium]
MQKEIVAIHRFLSGQAFYALLLSTALAMAMWFGRVFISLNLAIYRNLIWNLILAWLPYIFSFFAAGLHRLFPRYWWLLIVPGGLWLAFFPNAPYIVTDFLHLAERPHVPLWYDILLLATFSWTGIFLAVVSLRTMQEIVRSYLGSLLSWMFVGAALGLSGLGIYLGRFQRWNSWDLLTHPKTILKDIAIPLINPLNNIGFFAFTVLFTAFLLVCYLTFTSVHRGDRPESDG